MTRSQFEAQRRFDSFRIVQQPRRSPEGQGPEATDGPGVARKKQRGGKNRVTTEYLLDREVERVLAALMPQNRLIMRLVLHNGMRISDALAFRTSQLASSGWYVEKKTGKRRRFGMDAALLREVRAQAGTEWAFPGRDPRKHKTRQAVWADLKRAAKAFRLPQNVGPHSFRKVYAVKLLDKYGDIEKVRRNLNHSSSSVTAIYAISDVLLERRRREKRKI